MCQIPLSFTLSILLHTFTLLLMSIHLDHVIVHLNTHLHIFIFHWHQSIFHGLLFYHWPNLRHRFRHFLKPNGLCLFLSHLPINLHRYLHFYLLISKLKILSRVVNHSSIHPDIGIYQRKCTFLNYHFVMGYLIFLLGFYLEFLVVLNLLFFILL